VSEGTVGSACRTSRATQPAMQLHQGDQKPQQHDCENIKFKISNCSFNVTLRISICFEAFVVTADTRIFNKVFPGDHLIAQGY
jgi:hypothetical protein